MLMSAEVRGFVTWFKCFLGLLSVRYNCAKFHHCRICVTEFRERGALLPNPPAIREQPRQFPSWVGLKCECCSHSAAFCDFWVYSVNVSNCSIDVTDMLMRWPLLPVWWMIIKSDIFFVEDFSNNNKTVFWLLKN